MILLALAAALAAATPGPSGADASPPPPGPPPAFTLPARRELALENGLRVTLVQVGRLPRATVQLVVRAGTGDEAEGEAGLSRFVAGMLVEGTRARSAGEIAAQAARWGGAIETDVTPDVTLLGGTVLSEFAPDFAALVADVATAPAFPDRELERVRQDLLREVAIQRTLPQTLAQERFLALTYPGHGYGRLLPSAAALKGYRAEQVRAFHAASFVARRAHLYVAGRFDGAAVERAVRAAFAGWAPGTPHQGRPAAPTSRRAVNLVERAGAVQSSITIGLPVLDPRSPDYLRLLVTNTLLGGYFSSRITANIREAKGYTYSPRSAVSVRAGAPGYWAETADVTTAVTGAALGEILKEVERLRSEPPPPAELAAVQSFLAGDFLLRVSSRDGLLERLRFVDLYGLPPSWLEDWTRAVRAVTPEDVQRMARSWLDPARMTVVVVGDRAKVEGQVRALGPLVVAPEG